MPRRPTAAQKVRFAEWKDVARFNPFAHPARFMLEGRVRGYGKYRVSAVSPSQKESIELVSPKVIETWGDLYEPVIELFSVEVRIQRIVVEGFALGARGFEMRDLMVHKIRTHGSNKWEPGSMEPKNNNTQENDDMAQHFQQEPCVVGYEKLLIETDRAILFRFEGQECWIPRSQIDKLDEEDQEVTIPQWFAVDRGIIEE